jgi:hypothetical protein
MLQSVARLEPTRRPRLPRPNPIVSTTARLSRDLSLAEQCLGAAGTAGHNGAERDPDVGVDHQESRKCRTPSERGRAADFAGEMELKCTAL